MFMEIPDEMMKPIIRNEAYRMLGLGAPVKEDMMGYNKPDYAKVIELVPAMHIADKVEVSEEIYAYLANMLVKYVRQIADPTYTWIKRYAEKHPTKDSYYGLKARVNYHTVAEEARNAVEAELVDGLVELSFKYNPELIAAIKTIPGAKARKEMVKGKPVWTWVFPLTSIEIAIDKIEKHASAPALHEILEDNREVVEYSREAVKAEAISANKIRVEKVNARLKLKFAKNMTFVAAIKTVRGYRWHPDELVWTVPVDCATELHAALREAGADVSELEPYIIVIDEEDEELERLGILESLEKYEAKGQPLFDHQKDGVVFLLKESTAETAPLRGKILADDMGLGKTRQSIIGAFEYMMNDKVSSGKILVVCPASLKLNWEREIKMVFPFADVFVVNGNGWRQDEIDEATWVVINYDLLKKYEDKLTAIDWSVGIYDEAHFIKNMQSQRSKIVLGARKTYKTDGKSHVGIVNKCRRNYILTGTPVTSRPVDLFPLLKAIGHPLSKDWSFYVRRYCDAQQTRFGLDTKGASNLTELHNRIKTGLLRRTKEQCLDLPEKVRRVVPVSIDLRQYKKYWEDYKAKLDREGKMLQVEHLAMMTKLRQSSSIEKIPHAIEFINDVLEAGEKIIVFTNFTEVVDKLMEKYGSQAVKVVGGMSQKDKQQSVDRFQNDPSVNVFIGNIVAAGVGLTLTAATQVLFVDYSYVPAHHLQAEDRPYRIGQKNAVTVTYFNAVGTIDENIAELLAEKLSVVAQIVDGAKDVTDTSTNITADLIKALWGVGAL